MRTTRGHINSLTSCQGQSTTNPLSGKKMWQQTSTSGIPRVKEHGTAMILGDLDFNWLDLIMLDLGGIISRKPLAFDRFLLQKHQFFPELVSVYHASPSETSSQYIFLSMTFHFVSPCAPFLPTHDQPKVPFEGEKENSNWNVTIVTGTSSWLTGGIPAKSDSKALLFGFGSEFWLISHW